MYARAKTIERGLNFCRSRFNAGHVSTPFVLDTPCAGGPNHREVAKRQLADCLTGVSPQLSFGQSRPHCVIPLARGCGWTGVPLSFRLSSPCRGQPVTCSRLSRSPLFRRSRRTKLSWLTLSRIVGTEVLANEYSVFKVGEELPPHYSTATFWVQNRTTI